MNLGMSLDLRRVLLTVAVTFVLALVVGASGLACGDDSGSSGSGRERSDRSEERDRDEEEESEPRESPEREATKDPLAGIPNLGGTASKTAPAPVPAAAAPAPAAPAALAPGGGIMGGLPSISGSSIASEAAFEFVPAFSGKDSSILFYDVKTILTDGRVPDDLRVSVFDGYSHLENFCIFLDEIDTVVSVGANLIVSGDFRGGDLRGALENNGFTRETYRDYELWSNSDGVLFDLGFDSVAFPAEQGHVIIGENGLWYLQEALKDLQRGSNLMSADDSSLKQALDRAGSGLRVRAKSSGWTATQVFITSVSEEDFAADIRYVAMFESTQAAELASSLIETEVKNERGEDLDFLDFELTIDGKFVVADGTIDERSFALWSREAIYNEPVALRITPQGEKLLPIAFAAAAAAPLASQAPSMEPSPTPVPMCPSRSQATAPAHTTDAPAANVSIPDNPLDLVPNNATRVIIIDIRTILTEGNVPDVFKDGIRSRHENYLSALGIPIDAVTTVTRANAPGNTITIISGNFDQNVVKNTLEEQVFGYRDYRGYTLWSSESSGIQAFETDGNAVAFLGSNLLIGRTEFVEDRLRSLSRGSDSLIQGSDLRIKRALDKVGQGLTIYAGHSCIVAGCLASAEAMSPSNEDYAMDVRDVVLFGNNDDALSGITEMEKIYIEGSYYDVVKSSSRTENEFVVIEMTVDEESVFGR